MIRRLALLAGGGIVILAALLAALILATMPGEGGKARLPGLSAPVRITFGPRGVPFIRAANFDDAAEALGYLHARDRLFQMELTRRLASGRLSALFGERALAVDERMRRLGLKQAAIASEAGLSPATRAVLAAYARGVNAWISAKGRFSAWDFLIFGRPKPWRVRDSLLWGELLAYQLSGNARVELDRLALSASLPRGKIESLWPKAKVPAADTARLILPGAPAAALAALRRMPMFPAPFTGPKTASNEWAVAGPRSATGAPLLAGDPHLGFQFPGLWYLVRIDTPHRTLAGASAPGVPFLIFGHNRRLAWTFTNNGAAVQDIFAFRRIGKAHYLGPNGPLPF
ncbi:MAG TPA: penicillin acylase family protein, partial [Acetobacteraceae bacterium]|nr:penicillin acylase family protein [Acetobacteraceae bacterium]